LEKHHVEELSSMTQWKVIYLRVCSAVDVVFFSLQTHNKSSTNFGDFILRGNRPEIMEISPKKDEGNI
jgi:hypothetical protein